MNLKLLTPSDLFVEFQIYSLVSFHRGISIIIRHSKDKESKRKRKIKIKKKKEIRKIQILFLITTTKRRGTAL